MSSKTPQGLAGKGTPGMNDAERRAALESRVLQRRRELSERPDVSQRMRELSASGSRNPISPPPSKPRSRTRTIVIAVAAVVALLVCVTGAGVVIASGVFFTNQLNDPSTVVEDYYNALETQDFTRAYGYLSTNAQHNTSQSAFETDARADDALSGAVAAFTITSDTTNGSTAVITLDLVRRGSPNQATVETIGLVKQNGVWRIDSIKDGDIIPAPTPAP